MSTRFIRKESGTTKLLDRSTDAGVQYDTADGFLKYSDAGTVRNIVETAKAQILAGKQIQGIAPLSITGSSQILTVAAHDGIPLIVNRAAGCAITLPAATGSGACFRIWIGTTLTSGSFSVAVASGTDFMRGAAYTVGAAQATFLTANSGTVATESDTVTFNRTTTGLGTIGDYLEFFDIAAAVWSVELEYASSGTAATPFSAAV